MVAMNKGDWVGTKAQYIALNSIETNKRYYITDLETFVITNSAMASALTTYSGLYANGDTFLCIDSGTYKQNTFYKLNSGAWVEMGSLVTNAEKSKWDSKPENYQIISRPSLIPTANATSPDFVQVDGVTYKKVAKFSSETVADLTGTRWLFNDNPTAPAEDVAKLINFTSNGESFTAIVLAHYNWATSGMIYGNDTVYSGNNGWAANGYKEIVIVDGRDVTDNTLITWLSANATQVAYEYTQIGDGSNPNLLINGDFRINQRNLNTSSGGKYNFDRWKSWIANATFQRYTNSNNISSLKITVTGTGEVYQQYFEQEETNNLRGNDFTLSAELSSDGVNFTRYSFTKYLVNDNTNGSISTIGGAMLKMGIDSIGRLYVHIYPSDNQTIYVKYIKLEIGKIATEYIPRPYAEELALCQRYYFRVNSRDGYGCVASGVVYSTSRIFLTLPLPTTLRTSPTMSMSTSGAIKVLQNGTVTSFTSAQFDRANENSATIILNGSGFTLNSGALLYFDNDANAYIDFDAEI